MSKRQRDEGSEPQLIRGLPYDVAALCLLRIPVDAHASCKRVSKSWNSIFRSKRRFSRLRKEFGFEDRWLFTTWTDQETEMIHVKAFNLTTLSWHTMRATTPHHLFHGWGTVTSASIPREGVLFVFGAVACRGSTVNVFLKYQVFENRWTVIKAMTGKLGLVTAGVVDGKVYVTGLDKAQLSDGKHEPVEVFDPKKGTWKPVLPNYQHGGDFHSTTVFDGKLLLTYYDDLMTGQICDPITGSCEEMAGQLSKVLRMSRQAVEIHGHLFVLVLEEAFNPGGTMRLKVYDLESDSWDFVEGGDLHRGERWMSPVSSWDNNKIYVARDCNGCIGLEVGTVSRIINATTSSCSSRSTKSRFRVEWEGVDAPLTCLGASPVYWRHIISFT